MEFCDDEKLLKKLSDSAVLLDQVQKGLNDYLETKRGVFARFYFLSNDDLLSILSESKDVMRVRLGVLYLAVPRCCDAFTPSTRVDSIRRARGWSLVQI